MKVAAAMGLYPRCCRSSGGLAFLNTGVYDIAATKPHFAVTQRILRTVMGWSVKRQARDIEVPDLDDPCHVRWSAWDAAVRDQQRSLPRGVRSCLRIEKLDVSGFVLATPQYGSDRPAAVVVAGKEIKPGYEGTDDAYGCFMMNFVEADSMDILKRIWGIEIRDIVSSED